MENSQNIFVVCNGFDENSMPFNPGEKLCLQHLQHAYMPPVNKEVKSLFNDFFVINILNFEKVGKNKCQLTLACDCLDSDGNIVKFPADYKTGKNRFVAKTWKPFAIGDKFYIEDTGVGVFPSFPNDKFKEYDWRDIDFEYYRDDVNANVFTFEIFSMAENIDHEAMITIEEILDNGYIIYSFDALDENCNPKAATFSVADLAVLTDDEVIKTFARYEADRDIDRLMSCIQMESIRQNRHLILMDRALKHIVSKKDVYSKTESELMRDVVFAHFEAKKNNTDDSFRKFVEAFLNLLEKVK